LKQGRSRSECGYNVKNLLLNVYSLVSDEVIRIKIPMMARIVETRTTYRVFVGNVSRDGRFKRR
jgi:hypothetical protein